MSPTSRSAARRRRMMIRFGPLSVLALLAFGAGVIVASGSTELASVERFATAWEDQDFDAMYAELSPAAAAQTSPEEFRREYTRAQRIATIETIDAGELRGPLEQGSDEIVAVDLTIATDSFGAVTGELGLPVKDGKVNWGPSSVFPGLHADEELDRRTKPPQRAPILARDGTPLASGPVSARTTSGAGGIVTGEIGPAPAQRAAQMSRQGFPEGTLAGTSGLELAFDGELAGVPGGTLFASKGGERRPLASAEPTPGRPLKTTLDPALQDAAGAALGERFGGIAVLDARNGEVRALSGIAFSAPQPPGSTFKIVTTVAALEEGITSPDQSYPVVTTTNVGGRAIDNAHEGACGGTLVVSFAKSCNTVFAPLGAELGEEKLLDISERFGFNQPPTIYREDALAATQPPASTIPAPIGSDLDVAVSAIGQGKVLATPLQMASVAQTIANGGVRSPTPLVKGEEFRAEVGPVEVTDPRIARQVGKMMEAVVRPGGTGSAASIPGVQVAGKTGTAELGTGGTVDPDNPDAQPEGDVDAWFAAYAPAGKPRLAVAVMVVDADGDGGVVAAPIAREILAAGL